jgi:hypothetical protein
MGKEGFDIYNKLNCETPTLESLSKTLNTIRIITLVSEFQIYVLSKFLFKNVVIILKFTFNIV